MAPVLGRRRGLFVTLEGGEGAGKGSTLVALAEALRADGHTVVVTREPGGTDGSAAIRALVVERKHDWTPLSELLLLMADRAEHVARLVRPSLDAGLTVLCDRFEASTFAYQGAGKNIEAALIAQLQAVAAPDLVPDLTILLDVDPTIGLARSMQRLAAAGSSEDRFEKLGPSFHARVRESFLTQARAAPKRWIVVDAQLPVDQMIAAAVDGMQARLSTLTATLPK